MVWATLMEGENKKTTHSWPARAAGDLQRSGLDGRLGKLPWPMLTTAILGRCQGYGHMETVASRERTPRNCLHATRSAPKVSREAGSWELGCPSAQVRHPTPWASIVLGSMMVLGWRGVANKKTAPRQQHQQPLGLSSSVWMMMSPDPVPFPLTPHSHRLAVQAF